MFAHSSSVYSDERVLREEYTPEDVLGREDEIEEYRHALQPVVRGAPPEHIFLTGPPGVGKTAVTRWILDQLEDAVAEAGVDLSVVSLTCNDINSSYQLGCALINTLRDGTPRPRVSRSGLPAREIYDTLFEELDAVGGTVLLVLDEIDAIGNDDDILYEIPRAKSTGRLEAVDVGLIGISNSDGFVGQLSTNVQDSLTEQQLYFSPYDAAELRKILKQRASVAFKPECDYAGAVSKAAAVAASGSGSAREALDLLRNAADIADRRYTDTDTDTDTYEGTDVDVTITPADVDAARKQYEESQLEQAVLGLTTNQRLCFTAVLDCMIADNAPAETSAIYERYQSLANQSSKHPRSKRTVRNYLQEMGDRGLLDIQSGQGTATNRYQIALSVEDVLDLIDQQAAVNYDVDSARQQAQAANLIAN